MFWRKESKEDNTNKKAEKDGKSSWWSSKKESKNLDISQYPSIQDLEQFYQTFFEDKRCIISEGSTVTGDLNYTSPVMILGELKGGLVSSSEVILGPNAKIEGDLQCQSFLSFGTLKGNVFAEKIVLYPKSHTYADLETSVLNFADGVVFEGNTTMKNDIMSDHN